MSRIVQEVTEVTPLGACRIQAVFADAFVGVVDLRPTLVGPIFSELTDPHLFERVTVSDSGVVSWPNGADIDSDTLRYWCEAGQVVSDHETDDYFNPEPATARVAETP